MRTKSSIRIMMTIIMKLVPLMPTMPFDPGATPNRYSIFRSSGPPVHPDG